MSENRVLERKEVHYSGLFRVDEFATIIRKFARERGYFPVEKKIQEDVFESGKQVVMDFDLFKQISEYANAKIEINVFIKSLRNKEITLGGHKQKYEHGDISITMQPYLETDARNQWEGSAFQFVVRTLMDKFVRKDVTSQFASSTARDAHDLSEEMRSYLNITRFKLNSNKKVEPPA